MGRFVGWPLTLYSWSDPPPIWSRAYNDQILVPVSFLLYTWVFHSVDRASLADATLCHVLSSLVTMRHNSSSRTCVTLRHSNSQNFASLFATSIVTFRQNMRHSLDLASLCVATVRHSLGPCVTIVYHTWLYFLKKIRKGQKIWILGEKRKCFDTTNAFEILLTKM